MLAAEAKRALAGRAVGGGVDDAGDRFVVGQDCSRAFEPDPAAARSSSRRTARQSATKAVAAPSAQPRRSDLARVSMAWRWASKAGFGLGRAGRARQRADRGGQADEVEPLALEGVGGVLEPVAGRPAGVQAQRHVDQAGVAAVEAAEQVDRVGEVAGGVGARALDQLGEKGVGGATLGRDAGKLRLGGAEHLPVDKPVVRHRHIPQPRLVPGNSIGGLYTKGRKDGVYAALGMWSERLRSVPKAGRFLGARDPSPPVRAKRKRSIGDNGWLSPALA